MANVDAPRGFTHVGSLTGEPAKVLDYNVDASNAARIGKGDPITLEADGGVARSAANDGVSIGAVAVGFKNSDGESISYLPATTAGTIQGIPVRGQIFSVQADSGTALTVAAQNATANHVAGNCSTTTGVSIAELDSSDVGTGQELRILGKVADPNNSWAEHVDLLVQFVENAYDDTTSI